MGNLTQRISVRGALVVAGLCLLGARPQCDVRVPGAPCTAPPIVVEPGTCVEIDDPCGGDWSDLVSLSFVDTVDEKWFEVRRRSTGTTVSICAADTAALTLGDPATIRVVDRSRGIHDIHTEITTVAPLMAFVTAVPETVVALDTLRLTAYPSGGVPPYTYEWLVPCSEGDPIGDNTAQSILANGSCERYWLFLRDSFGGAKFVETIVPTYIGITVIALPAVIDPGGSAQLTATMTGGEILDMFWWSPTTGLSAPNSTITLANPALTTQYTFHAQTDRGLVSSGSVLVTVRP